VAVRPDDQHARQHDHAGEEGVRDGDGRDDTELLERSEDGEREDPDPRPGPVSASASRSRIPAPERRSRLLGCTWDSA
jgi:hypothetical protein